MLKAQITMVEDLNYKHGYVKCTCGWRKSLGNGFNGYNISSCPACTKELNTRDQRKVPTGSVGAFDVSIGTHTYFQLSNEMYIQYTKSVMRTYHVKTEAQADEL